MFTILLSLISLSQIEKILTRTDRGGASTSFDNDQTNGCVDSLYSKLKLEMLTDVQETTILNEFVVYSNPVNEKLFVSNKPILISSVEIHSTSGQLINIFKNGFNELDVSHLEEGKYIIWLYLKGGAKKTKTFFEK